MPIDTEIFNGARDILEGLILEAGEDDLVRVGDNGDIRVVRDYYYLASPFRFLQRRYEELHDRLVV